jgi:hypothetical protein
MVRLFASFGNYIYSTYEDGLAVHLYIQGAVETTLSTGEQITLRQQSRYPWDGQVRLTLEPASPCAFTLRLRVPGWCQNFSLQVNGQPVDATCEQGYLCIRRCWTAGDVVELTLDMPIMLVEAQPEVAYNVERTALQRGPLVYCLEGVDQVGQVQRQILNKQARRVILPEKPELTSRYDPDFLGGVVVIEGEALEAKDALWKALALEMIHLQPFTQPLREHAAAQEVIAIRLRAIPYYAWDNRQSGDMVVWIPRL